MPQTPVPMKRSGFDHMSRVDPQDVVIPNTAKPFLKMIIAYTPDHFAIISFTMSYFSQSQYQTKELDQANGQAQSLQQG